MSEYAMSRHQAVTETSSHPMLFDDMTFKDDDSETLEVPIIHDSIEGVSVHLGARAVAMKRIMAAYNQASQTQGALQHPEAFRRYRQPQKVQKDMARKADEMLDKARQAFNTITASAELKAAGFGEAELNDAGYDSFYELNRDIRTALNRVYGPGNAKKPARDKLVTRVTNIALITGASTGYESELAA